MDHKRPSGMEFQHGAGGKLFDQTLGYHWHIGIHHKAQLPTSSGSGPA